MGPAACVILQSCGGCSPGQSCPCDTQELVTTSDAGLLHPHHLDLTELVLHHAHQAVVILILSHEISHTVSKDLDEGKMDGCVWLTGVEEIFGQVFNNAFK